MILANGKDVDIIHQIFEGEFVGTIFKANRNENFYLADYIEESIG